MSKEQFQELLKEYVADFVNRESNRTSLITITDIALSGDGSVATLSATVFPDDNAGVALDFLNRRARDMRGFVMEKIRNRRIPRFVFVLAE